MTTGFGHEQAATHKAMPSHHLTHELLIDYASGAASEPMAMFVAAHLTFCPACRAALADTEALGGALLDDVPPVALASQALDGMLARLEKAAAPPPMPQPFRAEAPGVPAPLARYLDRSLDDLRWRRLMPGMYDHRLPLAMPGGKATLLRIRPGRAMPHHTHEGSEMTLVLRGSYTDRLGAFAPGDVAIVDESVDHRPVADRTEDCICLILTDAPLRLTGPVGRLVRSFVHF